MNSFLINERNQNLLLPFIIGTVFFGVFVGFSLLNPYNVSWLMEGDWAQAYLGWAFYKDAAWSYPLGQIPNFFSPFGAYIAYTDSSPLYSTIVKLFFGWFLPEYPIQIFGFWLLICFILHAYFTNLILLELKVQDLIYRMIAVVILLCSPVLLLRTGHITLCAQWLILFSIWNYIRSGGVKSIVGMQFLILFLAASTHPYLLLIVLCFSPAVLIKHVFYSRELSMQNAFLLFAFQVFTVFFTCYSFGYFSIHSVSMEDPNYGNFAANLNCFYNSMNESWFLKPFPVFHDQPAEGIGYLGFGILIMLVFLILFKPSYIIKNFKFGNPNFPLFGVALFLFLFALSTRVVWGKEIFLEFHHMELVQRIGGIFRYSARFIWVAHYLIILVCIVAYYKWLKPKSFAVVAFGFFAFIQLVDLSPTVLRRGELFRRFSGEYVFEGYDTLATYAQSVSRIVTYPPFDRTLVYNDDYMNYSFLAATYNKPITAGFLARFDVDKVERYRNEILPDSIWKSRLSNSLYVTSDNHMFDFFDALLSGKAFWVSMPPYNYILSSENKLIKDKISSGKYVKYDKGIDFLEKYRGEMIIISSRDEAAMNLSFEIKTYLGSMGSRVNTLQFRGSYLVVIINGQLVFEEINNVGEASVTFGVDHELKSFRLPKSLSLHAAGNEFGDISSIKVDNNELSRNDRGLNMVALDRDMNLLESINVDTHRSSSWIKYVSE